MEDLHRLPYRIVLSILFALAAWAGVPAGPGSSGVAASTPDHSMLHLLDAQTGHTLSPLDGGTLADLPSGPTISLAPATSGNLRPDVFTSSDGGRLVAAAYLGNAYSVGMPARDITIRTFDGVSGGKIAQFHPSIPIRDDGITPDGALLYGYHLGSIHGDWRTWVTGWYALSTRTGRIVRHVRFHALKSYPTLYDTVTQRLYTLVTRGFGRHSGLPLAPRLVAYNVVSGRRVGTLSLPGIVAGSGATNQQVHGRTVYAESFPGFALSPDGTRIALLDGNTDLLRLIDTRSLTLVRTMPLSQPQSPLDCFAQWLGLLPSPALAKGEVGADMSIHFSPDGRYLYAAGRKIDFNAQGKLTVQQFPLRAIDAGSGTVLGTTADGWMGISPDGGAVYGVTADGTTEILHRLDAVTLHVLAERVFTAWPQVFPVG